MTIHSNTLVASDYVICSTLRKVPDIFNIKWLWERTRSGQEGVFLLEALRRYTHLHHGRQRKETCYSHILVRVPERDYLRDNRLDDGFSRKSLLQDLQQRHQQELGQFLADNAVIRYGLEPDTVLRNGEIQFLFGRAIHIPAADESPLFCIQAASEGQGIWRTLGLIYPGQRLTLLNGNRRASSLAVAGWPFLNGESLLMLLRPEGPQRVDLVAEPPGSLALTIDGESSWTARDRRGRSLRVQVITPGVAERASFVPVENQSESAAAFVSSSPDAEDAAAFALSQSDADSAYPAMDPWGRREPVLGFSTGFDASAAPIGVEGPASSPAVFDTAEASPTLDPDAASTAEPEALFGSAHLFGSDQLTWVPQSAMAVVWVAGVALQRLSAYAAAGMSNWQISVNRQGGLVPTGHQQAVAWLRIDSRDQMYGEVAGRSTPLVIPGTWQPLPELELTLCAAPPLMATHYLGWMRLPIPLALPVPLQRLVSFGRGAEADIAPRLLSDPRSLRWDDQKAQALGINAEYLGLSRRHLGLQTRDDDWWIQLESQNMPVYRLAPSGDLLSVLSPGTETATAAKPGELLVVGSYVLALGMIG